MDPSTKPEPPSTAAGHFARELSQLMTDRGVTSSSVAQAAGVTPMTASRWRSGELALIRISPHLRAVIEAVALTTEQVLDLITEAVLVELVQADGGAAALALAGRDARKSAEMHINCAHDGAGPVFDRGRLATTICTTGLMPGASWNNPMHTDRCPHPDDAREGCSACCDACNNDQHRCDRCGQPVGHSTIRCTDCPPED